MSNVVGWVIRRGLVPQSGEYLHQDRRSWSTVTNRLQTATLSEALDVIDHVAQRCRVVRVVRRPKASAPGVTSDCKASRALAVENLRLRDERDSLRTLLNEVSDITRRAALLKGVD